MTNILLIGHGAREHVIAETLKKNKEVRLYSFIKSKNPGILELSEKVEIGNYSELDKIKDFAEKNKADFAFIGPEDPLSEGIVDKLQEVGIPSIGPLTVLAQLETSKAFTRNLLEKYDIDGNPKFKIINVDNIGEINDALKELNDIVIKPDGLTGGKGVKVQGDHFDTKEEAVKYCVEVLETHPSVIIEEKLDGEEFSLQCLTDGKTVVGMPVVQDHKRAYEGDKGPNTGGMGSYSSENHLLPFLKQLHVDKALEITKKVAKAIYKETGLYYKGIMYGGFILTKEGVKLIEFNARFGDPEAMNVLPLLKTDFAGICQAIIVQELDRVKVEFEKKATVCKYVVPEGYPDDPETGKIEVPSCKKDGITALLYYGAVEEKEDGIYTTKSRGVAFVGMADTIEEAEKIAEEAASKVKGKVFHRKDIGTKELIQKRIDHINTIG